MKYLVDTSAWIEYLDGSRIGEKVDSFLIHEESELFIIPQIISETISKVKREKGNVESAFKILIRISKIINIDAFIAKEAGLLHAEQRKKNVSFGLTDALIIKTAQKHNLKILTTDNHFKSFKEAIIL